MDFFWPSLTPPSSTEQDEIKQEELAAQEAIKKVDWTSELSLAMQEAHRIASEEEGRLKSVESKATNLLLFIGALIPLLTYLETATLDAKIITIPIWPSLALLAIAVVYFVKASLWAFRTINVGNYHRVYSADLVEGWSSKEDVRNDLVVRTLTATRLNQETINSKVSSLKMTHAFLLRAIIVLSALLLLQVLFKAWGMMKQPLFEAIHSLAC